MTVRPPDDHSPGGQRPVQGEETASVTPSGRRTRPSDAPPQKPAPPKED